MPRFGAHSKFDMYAPQVFVFYVFDNAYKLECRELASYKMFDSKTDLKARLARLYDLPRKLAWGYEKTSWNPTPIFFACRRTALSLITRTLFEARWNKPETAISHFFRFFRFFPPFPLSLSLFPLLPLSLFSYQDDIRWDKMSWKWGVIHIAYTLKTKLPLFKPPG